MSPLVAVAVGFLAARLLWLLLRPAFDADLFARTNFRGASVATAAGVVIAVAVVAVEATRTVVAAAGVGSDEATAGRAAVLVAVVGFALLGLFDDLAAAGPDRGFAGHLRALASGRLTTGALKLVGGAAVAIVAVGVLEPASVLRLLGDAALVALAANLGNLFDRAPGRTTKVGVLCAIALLVATAVDPDLTPAMVVVGAAVGLLPDDLRERLMLGDTGANPLGAALGLAVVATCSATTRTVVLVVVLVLNLLSEAVSYSRVIDRVPPLRVADRLGRRP
jgi:UDP-GlcNAc:undecaprenyl-phosphate/decaprenyl-phosphate GlcNAc-1-phosphate transferase